MVDDDLLLDRARKAIRAGDLPSRLPDRVWAGAGTTGRCAICGKPMAGDLEFEMVFTDEWQAVEKSCSVHRCCLKAFECAVGGLLGPPVSMVSTGANVRLVAHTVEPPE